MTETYRGVTQILRKESNGPSYLWLTRSSFSLFVQPPFYSTHDFVFRVRNFLFSMFTLFRIFKHLPNCLKAKHKEVPVKGYEQPEECSP